MRKILGLLSLLVFMVTVTGCGSKVNTGLSKEGVLVVGMECAYAPFNWTETEKTDTNVAISNVPGAFAEGYDVQVAKMIAEELGLELQVKALEWGALINNLNTDGIDLIIAGMSPTAERLQSIDFTNAYYESTHVLLVKQSSKFASATSLDEFKGAKVIGQTGTLYASLVPQAVEHGAIAGIDLNTVPEIVNAIIHDTVDATILEEPVAKGIVSQYAGSSTPLTYVKLTNGGFTVADEDRIVSIGVRKGFTYTEQINNVLTNVITSSVRQQLMEQAINNAPSGE
jgi:ABC-type amino acid transport substrate-binding protein